MTDKIEWHLNGTPGPWYADHESVMAANPWDDSDHDVMTSAVYPGGYTRNGDADEIRRQTNARAIREDERARVVLFLRNRDNYDFDDLATDIADGEHLK